MRHTPYLNCYFYTIFQPCMCVFTIIFFGTERERKKSVFQVGVLVREEEEGERAAGIGSDDVATRMLRSDLDEAAATLRRAAGDETAGDAGSSGEEGEEETAAAAAAAEAAADATAAPDAAAAALR